VGHQQPQTPQVKTPPVARLSLLFHSPGKGLGRSWEGVGNGWVGKTRAQLEIVAARAVAAFPGPKLEYLIKFDKVQPLVILFFEFDARNFPRIYMEKSG